MKVKVRIAVAVDPHGYWNAAGGGCAGKPTDDRDMMELATEPLEPGELRYWLEAELDVPETCTVTPTVTLA